jgi:hypothetical protein
MKRFHLKITSLLTALTVAISSIPLSAAEPFELPWNQVCHKVADRELVITTTTGETVDGYCIAINVNEISVNVKGNPVNVAKNSVAKLLIIPRRHQLKSLGKSMGGALSWSFRTLFTPGALFAMVTIPATLAWGAVAAPFCVIGDLGEKWKPDQEIRVK